MRHSACQFAYTSVVRIIAATGDDAGRTMTAIPRFYLYTLGIGRQLAPSPDPRLHPQNSADVAMTWDEQ